MDSKPVTPPPLYRLGAFKLALWGSRTVPRPVGRFIASTIARALYAGNNSAQKSIRQNLATVTGLEGTELDRLCHCNALNFGRMICDYFYSAVAAPDDIRRQVSHWEGMENLRAAREAGRGVIIITAHLGHWELGALILALDGLPMSIVTLEEPSSELTQWRRGYREKLGIRTILVGGDQFAFVEMMRALRSNECVAMLVDRPYEGSGTPVTFFGRETQFSTGPALLHQHTGAAVVPAFVVQSDSNRYRCFIEPAVDLVPSTGADDAIAANTQRIATRFESIIKQYPEQWFNYVPIWPQ